MQVGTHYKSIIAIAAPISFSLLIPQVSFMANAVFLGRLGNTELVVNGLTSIYYLLLTFVGFGLSNGITILLSRSAGANNSQALGKILGNGVVLTFSFSIVMLLLSYLIAPAFFKYTLKDPVVYQGTVSFLQYRILGLPFLMLTQLINGFYIAISKSRFLIYGAVVGNVINVFLDYGLIFGHWGMPLLGLRGAAYASIIAELSSMIVMYALFVAHKMQLHFAVFHHIKWNIKITRDTMKVSMPLIVQYIFSIGGWQIFFIYIEHLGIVESAASHILRSVLGIVSIGTWALASTCNSMVSNLVGQGNLQAIMALVRKILLLSFAFAASVSLLLYCFPVVFLSAYTNDAAVISTARSSLNLLCISTLIMALATICFNAVVGLGKTWINLCIEVLCVSLYVVYIVVVMGYGSGNLLMAWASEFVYWISLLVLSGLYLKLGSWQRKMQPA